MARALAGVLAAGVLLAGCAAAGDAGGDVEDRTGGAAAGVREVGGGDGLNGAVLDRPYRLAPTTLTDSGGDQADLKQRLAAGQALTLLFFGYTHCPDICQAVMADLASTMARLPEEDAQRVRVWFVTTDPARDDAETLRGYLDRFDASFEGFTGRLPDIVEVARSAHVPIERGAELPTGGYDITHGTPILGVTPRAEVSVVWTEGTSAARLAEDLTAMLGEG